MSKRGGKKRRYTGLLVFLIVVLVLCSVSIIILGILLYQKKVLADRGPSLPQIQSSVSTEETIKEMSTEAVIDEMTSQTEESVETASETAVQALEKPENPDAIIDLSTALYSYQKMENDLQLLAGYYPQYMTLDTAGVTTADGRNLYVIYFGNQNASRQIFICAATHAREYMTAQLVMKQLEYYCAHYEDGSYNGTAYRDIFENTCFVIVPMVNPDGVSISQFGEEGLNREDLRQNLRAIYESDKNGGYTDEAYDTYLTRWKANGMGVDLNRNYSPGWESVTDRTAPSSGLYKGTQPGSEAESQALMNIVDGLSNPLLAISYHSYGSLVYWQYGQAEPLWSKNQQLAAHVEALTTYYQAGYSNEAGFSNWCVNVKGIPSVTIETGLVPTPLPLDQFELLWSQNKEMWAMLGTTY
ncbi:MAG: M14 family zinc carboxypeptidase [Lachnospiraceae bacterium]